MNKLVLAVMVAVSVMNVWAKDKQTEILQYGSCRYILPISDSSSWRYFALTYDDSVKQSLLSDICRLHPSSEIQLSFYNDKNHSDSFIVKTNTCTYNVFVDSGKVTDNYNSNCKQSFGVKYKITSENYNRVSDSKLNTKVSFIKCKNGKEGLIHHFYENTNLNYPFIVSGNNFKSFDEAANDICGN